VSVPEIDVIIPVYNGEMYLERAVLSAVRQSLPPARILICDDGSTDATPAIAQRLSQRYPQVEHLRLRHGGEGAARNSGIAVSTAPYIAFLDADDVWFPEKLEKLAAIMESSDDHTGAVYSLYTFIDEFDNEICDEVRVPTADGDIFDILLYKGNILPGSPSVVMVRRSVLENVGPFDERLFNGADWDMWLRIAAVCRFEYVSEILVYIRIHANSIQRRHMDGKQIRFFMQHLLIYDKWTDRIRRSPEFVKLLRKRALLLMLPYVFQPSRIESFYNQIMSNSEKIGQIILGRRRDLWRGLLEMLARYGLWRLRRGLMNDQRPFLDVSG